MNVPFWFQDRSKPATLERERKHLADMQAHERRMIAAGYQIRLKAPKAKSSGDSAANLVRP